MGNNNGYGTGGPGGGCGGGGGGEGSGKTLFFDRLHEALQILAEFFFAGGLMGAKLYTENFNKLDVEFALQGVSTAYTYTTFLTLITHVQ